MFVFAFGIWVIRVANLGAMDDRDLAVVGYYRNDDVCTESFVMSIIVFVYGSNLGAIDDRGRRSL